MKQDAHSQRGRTPATIAVADRVALYRGQVPRLSEAVIGRSGRWRRPDDRPRFHGPVRIAQAGVRLARRVRFEPWSGC